MVYSPLKAASKYFQYYINAANSKGHGTHSPFIFDFITKVLNDFTVYTAYEKIEDLRKKLLKDQSILTIEDFGAGSAKTKSNKRTVASITKNAAKPAKYGQLMYRMVKHYGFRNILELGTSMGFTTAYLAAANESAKVITMEGAEEIARKAGENFAALGLNNIEIIRGNFDDTLKTVPAKMPLVDFAFIDGNHRQAPTEQYFKELLPYVHNDSIVVLDDIHWSKGMEQAWTNIIQHEQVTCYIDLFFIGIVTFRNEFKEKQEFKIRF